MVTEQDKPSTTITQSKSWKSPDQTPQPKYPDGRTIAIVGFAETSRMRVLAEPDTTEIWSLNRCYTFLPRWDVHFEIHEEDLVKGKTGLREKEYVDMLKSWDCPILMLHPDPSIPNARQLPLTEFNEHFRDYYTTSIAYMLAMAAYEHEVLGKHIREIHMYGIDMSAYSEYSEQLPCVNYWIGVIEGLLGQHTVVIPSVSPLLKCASSYGRHSERPLWKMAKERLQHHKGKQAQLSADLGALTGRSNEYEFVFEALKTLNEEIDKGEVEVNELISQLNQHFKVRRQEINKSHAGVHAELNATLGGLREVQHWMVALNAPQTEDEEPDVAKTPSM